MRQMVKFATLLGSLIFSAVLAAPPIAQQARSTSLSPLGCKDMLNEYDYALDQLFPRDAGPKGVRPQDVDYTIVVRYLPSFQTESQIVIVKQRNGTLDLTRYDLQSGKQSIWAVLNKFYEKQSCPSDADLRTIQIVVTRLDPVPDEVKYLVANLFEQPVTLVIDPSMRPGLSAKDRRFVMMDGETVYLWLSAFQDSAFFKLWGPFGNLFDSPLYDWADRLRKAARR